MPIVKTPTQIREEQAQGLVSILNDLKAKIDEDKVNLRNVLIQLNGLLERFYNPKGTLLSRADSLKSFIFLLERKKCDSLSFEPRCNINDIAEDTKALIESIIAEINTLGIPMMKAIDDKSVNVNTTVTQNQEQNQSQQQEVIVKILLEAVKDELNGKQRKELLSIVEESKDPKAAHRGIFTKIKEFGVDVAASIVANILANPQVLQNIGSLL